MVMSFGKCDFSSQVAILRYYNESPNITQILIFLFTEASFETLF